MAVPERSEARAQILARIQSAKPRTAQSDAARAWAKIPREYEAAPMMCTAEILRLLEDRLQDYDAHVFRCGPALIAATVADALRRRGKGRMVLPAGPPVDWLPSGFDFFEDRNVDTKVLDEVDGVLTGATLAIAETGTIVLQNAEGQGRRPLTLVPDYHLCVVLASRVVQTVPEAMRRLLATATLPTTLVSGPSATADIEMTRIKGVHGPRFLDVILVEDIAAGGASPSRR
jgi:L-lactate dehydrogenase complex protein LldG